jgi:protein-S-isoprenylcysteine O-methyltransferase Ste14
VTPQVGVGEASRVAVGVALMVSGFAATAVGFFSFRRASTTIDPVRIGEASQLVTGGIYQITRNPMYVGMAWVLLGLGVLLGSPASLLGPVVFVGFITRFQIIPEERVLLAKFGADYAQYKTAARRWL